MSEFHSELEKVSRDEKLRWLEDPVTRALLATIGDLSEQVARRIVSGVRNRIDPRVTETLGAHIDAYENLTNHIKFVRKDDVTPR